jgi:tRNA threonylcarbamoyladenosine biosynthesis protein TsaB
MILALRTDSPEAEVYLLDTEGKTVDTYIWQAHRTLARDLLKVMNERLISQKADWQDIEGIVLYKGPGSFTGLRIGAAVANTVAYSENVPIVGTNGEKWLDDGFARLRRGENNKIILPEYGSAANITKPKK